MVADYAADRDPKLRVQVARALVNQAIDLAALDRLEDAITVNRQVAATYAADPDPGLRDHVSKALVNQATDLRKLGRSDEALALYRKVITDYGADLTPTMQARVGRARAQLRDGKNRARRKRKSHRRS